MRLHHAQDTLSVHDANITDASFTNARLVSSRFDDVNLQGAAFMNVSLAGANFVDVNLTNVHIANANLAGMRINGVLVSEMLQAYQSQPRPALGAGAVLYAKDLARMQAFYQAVLGCDVEQAQDDHVVLASPGFQLVVVRIPEHVAASIVIERPARRRTGTPIKLAFDVASLSASRVLAAAHGGEFSPPEGEWDVQGYRVCDGQDPEGNVLQLRQIRQ